MQCELLQFKQHFLAEKYELLRENQAKNKLTKSDTINYYSIFLYNNLHLKIAPYFLQENKIFL